MILVCPMSSGSIIVKGARVHNLKNISVEIPRNKLVVLTGLSGSGKSSLAFDTIYAEGQRRYVESLSAYARQFLGLMDKPDVDEIRGLSPAISIDQKSVSHNPRSTVGTVTEIHDYLRLLFARAGHPHCPQCGREVARQTVDQIIARLLECENGTHLVLVAPVIRDKKGEHKNLLQEVAKAGFTRIRFDGRMMGLEEALDMSVDKQKKHMVEVVVDEVEVREELRKDQGVKIKEQETRNHRQGGIPPQRDKIQTSSVSVSQRESPRQSEAGGERSSLAQSVETALDLGDGIVVVESLMRGAQESERSVFSEHFACPLCNISLPELEPRLFSFNSPHGACSTCTGLGTKLEVDPDLVIPNKRLSIAEGAIRPWSRTSSNQSWMMRILEAVAQQHGFSLNEPMQNLSPKALHTVLYGTPGEHYDINSPFAHGKIKAFLADYEGVIPNLERRYKETESDYMRAEIERYMRISPCPACQGNRLKPEVLAVTIVNKNISEIVTLSVTEASSFFAEIEAKQKLSDRDMKISRAIIKEVRERLSFLSNVGLDYLTL